MKTVPLLALGVALLLRGTASLATPPGAGQPFDCSEGGSTSCAWDDGDCVPTTDAHRKCGDALATAIGKAIQAVAKCHRRQADDRTHGLSAAVTGPAEDACSNANGGKSARSKLDAVIAKVSSRCSAAQLTAVAALEATLFADRNDPAALDAQNGAVYCDGTTEIDPGGDDAGNIPGSDDRLACADATGTALAKLAAAVIKCHRRMADAFFVGKEFDERGCEDLSVDHKSALEKYEAVNTHLDIGGTCTQVCLGRKQRSALALNVLSQIEAANSSFYPCGQTTTTTIPGCGCGGGMPATLTFTSSAAAGTCGQLDAPGNPNFFQLTCGRLYFGGAGAGFPPAQMPDQVTSVLKVSSCTGTSLTLTATTPAEAGGNRCVGGSNHGMGCTSDGDCPGGACKLLRCTTPGCLFGPPVPLSNSLHGSAVASACVLLTVNASPSGSADCETGALSTRAALTADVFVTGDLLPARCSGGSTPGAVCSPVGSACAGGGVCANDFGRCTNDGAPCTHDTDCTSGTCETGVCAAGANAGKGCVTDGYCPGSVCRFLSQPCPICNPVTLVCNGGPNDGLPCTPGASALDGNYPTSHDCPPPSATQVASVALDAVLSTKLQGRETAPGTNFFCGYCRNSLVYDFKNPAVSCSSDADCAGLPGFTKCGQRTPGAFTIDDVAHAIVESGAPAGALTVGGPAKPAGLATIGCIPPSFDSGFDYYADLPGPLAVSIAGTVSLEP